MLKGKTIQSSTPVSLKPKIIKSCSELEFDKTVIKNESVYTEIIQRTQNMRYSLEELKSRFPGYSTLYYSEIFELLQSTDYNLTELNLNSNIQKFINLGNNIQSQISRLHQNLDILSKNSFKDIKTIARNTIGFFAMEDSVNSAFIDFNADIQNYSNLLYKELEDLKSIDFSKYNLLNLYLDFFLFVHEDLKSKFPDSTETNISIIESRVLSLNNSKIVLDQFKTLLEIEIGGKEIEYNNIKNYLDTLLPSLHILRKQNFKEFKEQFRNLIKD